MNNINTLVSFNRAFMSYKEFLFNSSNQLYDNPQNIKTIEILFTCLNIILNKDRINTKDENTQEYIDDTILEQILSIIATKKDNTYYLGNLPFQNKEDIIKTIRNKIAHGEFFIDQSSDNILFFINNQEVKISRKALYSFTILLIERNDLYTISSSYNRTQLYASASNAKRIKSKRDISNMLDKIYYIDYSFSGSTPITPSKKALIEEILKKVPEIISNYEELTNSQIPPDILEKIFHENDIEVKTTIKSLSSTNYSNILSSFISKNLQQIKRMDIQTQIILISNWYQKLLNDEKPLENITNGIHYNLLILHNLEHKKFQTLNEALEDIRSNNLFTSIIEIILVTELLGFYLHYHYPLENICKSKDNQDDLDYFDYSKLNLRSLKPTIFKLPEGRHSSYSEGVSATQKRLEKIDEELNRLNVQVSNIKRLLSTTANEEEKEKFQTSLNIIEEKINKILTRQLEEIITLQERQKQLTEFNIQDNTSYYYNRYLIEYIRNAISHGNVHFYYSNSSTSIEDCILRFINKKNNQTTLDLQISLKDFDSLFNIENLSILDTHITEYKKDRKL